MITVAQFSDLHFSRPGNRSHGGMGYDTDVAWEAVFAHAFGDGSHPDYAVITGDVADHGERHEYGVAVAALERIPVPANVLAGNHDYDIPIRASVPRPGLTMDRSQRIGPWLFVFADTNAEFREVGAHGRLVDTEERIETNGLMGPAEVAWIDDLIGESDAEHVWLWMHHPPAMSGIFHSPDFDREIEGLCRRHERIRGIGAGHVHTDLITEIANRPVHLCPALTINVDLEEWTTLPPGYRSYEFVDDGSVASSCHLIDDGPWRRNALTDAAIEYYRGALSWDDLLASFAATRAARKAT